MDYQDKSKEELIQKLSDVEKENIFLKELNKLYTDKTRYSVKLNKKQSRRFELFNKYTLGLAEKSDSEIASFIVKSFKDFFHVKEVWLAFYNEKNSELVLEASTLSEKDRAEFMHHTEQKLLWERTKVTPEIYQKMLKWGVGEPCSLHDASFGTIPVPVSSVIEKTFSFGWFQGIAMTNKGKLFGGVIVAGYNKQPVLQKYEIQIFTELTSAILNHRKIEKELSESEKRFHHLSDLLPQLVFEVDAKGNVTFINQYGLNLFGYTHDEFDKGLNFFKAVAPEERKRMYARFHEVLKGAKTSAREYSFKRKNGEKIPLLLDSTLVEEDGKPKGIRGIGIDLTDKYKAEAKLFEEHSLLRTLIDTIPDRIYAKDEEGRIIICNKAMVKYLGKDNPDEIIGRTIFEFFSYERATEILKDEQAFLKSDKPILKYEENLEDYSGDKRWNLIIKVPFYDIRGNNIGIVCIGRDISERKMAEMEIRKKNQELLDLNAQKDKFFSIIAHDLLGPFGNLLGFAQIMTDELESMSYEEIQNIAISMRKSASNLYALLGNLLEWSKMQRGLMDFKPEKINLHSSINNCIELISEEAIKKNITIRLDIREEINIDADSHMFDSVIRNLVSNAIKFTQKGGNITISASASSNNSVKIIVNDTGIGMNTDMQSRLFKLNEQINRKGTEGEPSTGLGLLLCKEFIEKHDGILRVESEEGKGSTFSFCLAKSEQND